MSREEFITSEIAIISSTAAQINPKVPSITFPPLARVWIDLSLTGELTKARPGWFNLNDGGQWSVISGRLLFAIHQAVS